MSTTTDPALLTLEERIAYHRAAWSRYQAAAQAELEALMALLVIPPDQGVPPAGGDPHAVLVREVARNDQILWDDGWWLIADATVHQDDTMTLDLRRADRPFLLRLGMNERVTIVRAT